MWEQIAKYGLSLTGSQFDDEEKYLDQVEVDVGAKKAKRRFGLREPSNYWGKPIIWLMELF